MAASASAKTESERRGPAQVGYRWPAEWEPHAATWLSWPHNPETWPHNLAAAEAAFVAMVGALVGHETVRINVAGAAMEEHVRRRLEAGGVATGRVEFFAFPTDDAWVRDHGPVFLVRDSPIRDPEGRDPEGRDPEGRRERALVDFGFDAWGGKYPPWDRDDAIPRQVAEALALPRFAADFVLEGGSVDGDGAGTVLTTESCLLHPNRGAGRTRESMEERLHAFLGAEQVLWLGDGIVGDDTDGHVDDVTRFVAPGTVVTALEADASDPNHTPLAENLRRLRGLRDAGGKPLAVATLPMPPPLRSDGERLPATYANFYLANRVALVPIFGAPADARALAVLGELLPGREIVPIPARDLVHGLGAVHCLTQQEPAANRPV